MLRQNAQSLYGSVTSPGFVLKDATPLNQLSFDARVDENLFNQSAFDSTDLHTRFGLSRQIERWAASLQQTVDYDTTRSSEPTNYGLTVGNARHLGLSVAPQIAFKPTPLDQLSLAGNVTASRYDSSAFTDYSVYSLTPSYTHHFTPLNAGILSFLAQRYQTTSGARYAIDNYSPSLGWITSLTPRLSAKFLAGVQATRPSGETSSSETWSWQYVFSADVLFKGDQDLTHFIATRSQYPFGNGTDALLQTFSIKEEHKLNPAFSLNLEASYQSADYPTATDSSLDTLVSGRSGLTYYANDHLAIKAAYQYRYETLTNTSASIHDNMITVGVSYSPQAWDIGP